MEAILDGGIIQVLVAIGGGFVTLFQSFKFVQEGSLGLKLRFGKVVRDRNGSPKVINPGFVWMIPFVDTLKRRHVRQQEVTLDEQVITLKSGLTFRVAGALYFRVTDVYKALFEIELLDESIEQLAMGAQRDEIAKHDDHNDLAETAKISQVIFDEIKKITDEWGVDLIDFRLTTVAPTSESAPIVNLEAGAAMRTKVLQSIAVETGVKVGDLISNGLAAIMIGAPLVASAVVSDPGTSSDASLATSDEDDD